MRLLTIGQNVEGIAAVRPNGTVYWTTYAYDASGRTLTVTTPDGASKTQYSYLGNSTTVTDPAGKWKTSTVDAYGNIIQVTEPNPSGGNFTTSYTYTPFNQLTGVSMTRGTVTQTRTFLYTGSDLTSATNPENGTVTYVYDQSHHVTSRTDANGSNTQYTYDTYGRLSEVQYFPAALGGSEDTSQRVTYQYDSGQYGMGRLTSVNFGGGFVDEYKDTYSYSYKYNAAGRVTTQTMNVSGTQQQFENSVQFQAGYQWDDEGRMTSLTYPSVKAWGSFGGMTVNMPIAGYQYDANGRLNAITMDDGNGPQPLANATYTAAGQLYQLSWGPIPGGVPGASYTETRTYNSLNQLTNQAIPFVLNMTYNYSATANNGRITSSVDSQTGESTTYTYDALNRLTKASNSLWSETYAYDGFGNLTSKAGTGGSPNPAPSMTTTYNSKNQQNGVTYDANGNPAVQTPCYFLYPWIQYTVENRLMCYMVGQSANEYAYDPWGKRVMSGSDPSPSSPQPLYTYTFYGITGQPLAMVTCNGAGKYPYYPSCAIVGQNVYFGKKMIVSGGVGVVTDRMGSIRANNQGEWFMYYPFGEERSSTVDGRPKFGTYFRDGVGQDYADQRYYNAGMGRFWTADPGGIKTADSGNPTSWNRYAYVNGDPINFSDPRGLCAAGFFAGYSAFLTGPSGTQNCNAIQWVVDSMNTSTVNATSAGAAAATLNQNGGSGVGSNLDEPFDDYTAPPTSGLSQSGTITTFDGAAFYQDFYSNYNNNWIPNPVQQTINTPNTQGISLATPPEYIYGTTSTTYGLFGSSDGLHFTQPDQGLSPTTTLSSSLNPLGGLSLTPSAPSSTKCSSGYHAVLEGGLFGSWVCVQNTSPGGTISIGMPVTPTTIF